MTMPIKWRRAVTTFQGAAGKAGGGRALLVAIIGQAALDLAEGDRGAAAYFLSDLYRGHLQQLGLSDDMLPDGVTHAELRALVGLASSTSSARPRRQCRKMSQNVAHIEGV